MRKTIAIFFVFSVFLFSGSLYAEKKGSEIVIHKMDGQQANGELIAVKEDSLLLMEKATGSDVSARIGDIRKVKIVKKSKALLGAGLGSVVVGGAGAIIGAAQGSESVFDFTTGEKAMIFGGIFGLTGLILGGVVGAAAGADKTNHFDGSSDLVIKAYLNELRKKARITDFQ